MPGAGADRQGVCQDDVQGSSCISRASLGVSLPRKGLTFVSVHDCFWTHAADIPTMNEVGRVSALGGPTSRRWGLDPRSLYHG